jgi:DNA polymerase elongation subunit (family B)
MEEIYNKRKEMKRHMLDAEQKYEETKDPKYKTESAMYNTMQLSYKTLLNSCYGAIGNQYFRLYNVDMAESITISGQLSIQWIQRRINKYLNKLLKTGDYDYIVAGDTDSFYMSLAKFVDKVVGNKNVSKEKIVDLIDGFFEEKIQPKIDESYNELADYMNAYEQQMIMKREVIADRGIWRAKKNYALNVYDSEGVRYAKPKLKIMGIEAIKSSTPELCRDALKESIRIILQESEANLQKYVKEFKKKFINADTDVIAFPSGISDLTKWHYDDIVGFKKGTPFHVKGAIAYNRLLNKKKLSGKYREINNGDKIKYIYLSLPNPIHNNVIAWADILPPEFELDKYINYQLQYEKSYLHPLESITNKIGWMTEKKNTLF